jgi:hypothetical protein
MTGLTPSSETPSPQRPPFPYKIAIGLVVALMVTLAGLGYELGALSAAPAPSPSPTANPVIADYVNLTVQLNATTGAPQYVPANFSVPAGLIAISIDDEDSVMPLPACPCNVTGTVGNVEWLNGTPYSVVPNSNVAHTFTIPQLGLNVLSPGGSTVFFEAVFQPGTYTWYCMAPCGSNGDTGFPMGTPGYMEGMITVG